MEELKENREEEDRIGEDRISNLPDSILAFTLSFLTIKQSARISSSRWRRLWLLSPLVIDDEDLLEGIKIPYNERDAWCINTVSHILSVHPGPVRACSFRHEFWEDFALEVVELLEILTQRGIQQLYFSNDYDFLLLHCILRCESLRFLSLLYCKLADTVPQRIFPNLKRLKVKNTGIHSHALSHLLRTCSITELEISDCDGLKQVYIESGS